MTCGTPMPSTSRVVQAAPGPTPTKMPAAPWCMSWYAASPLTVLPTRTGSFSAAGEVGQRQHPGRGRDVPGDCDLRLDEEEVGAGLGGELGVMPGRCRRRRDRRDRALRLDARDERA